MQSFKDLIVWQRAIELIEEIYFLSKSLSYEEKFGLISQMRRAAISIASNIAEGYKRRTLGDYIRFLCIADGSAAELETQLIVTSRLFPNANCKKAMLLCEEIQKMLTVLINKLRVK